MRYPKPLVPGDRIGVTAPSSGVSVANAERLNCAIANLRSRGFAVVEGSCLRKQIKFVSAPKELRAAEFQEMYLRDDIAAIYPPWGGEFLIEILPLLDWDLLRQAPPKWIVGYSDISTLLLPLTILLDMGTIHGTNLMENVPEQKHPFVETLFTIMGANSGDIVNQISSEKFQSKNFSFEHNPQTPFQLDSPVDWKVLVGQEKMRFSGRLIGGCIDTITFLTGTPFGRVEDFNRRYQADGVILYLENCELDSATLLRALCNLKMAGWFNHVNGVLLGRFRGKANDIEATTERAENSLSYNEVLEKIFGDLEIPVLYDVDIGHLPPQLSLVNGACAIVKFDKGRAEIIQQLI